MKKKIILSVISIILTLFCFVTLTFSWFAFNDKVSAGGLTVSVKDVENLVIATSESDLNLLSPDNKQFSVAFTGNNMREMIACTHSDTSATFLKYVVNTYDIDVYTGHLKEGKTAIWEDAPQSTQFYFDSTVYIASTQAPIVGKKLVATILNASVSNPIHLAASVDFYVSSVSQANFKGTLNIAGLDASVNDGSTTCTEIVILDGVSSGQTEIPLNYSDDDDVDFGYIKVIMRFYFDGNLETSSDITYINTDQISTDEIAMHVNFGLEDID